ncbi:MAG: phage tail family protein [Lachnospiraceae bacterium]|nr:phage tail family protein [Lachnospiraceae bacterium]
MLIKDFELDFDHKIKFSKNILQCDGLSETSIGLETAKNAGSAGNHIIGKSKESRLINIKVKIDNSEVDYFQRYFASGIEHTLYVGTRKINCHTELSKIERDRGNLHSPPVLVLQLYAPDPYFYDVYDFGKNLAGTFPMLGFPWTSTLQYGFSTGYQIYDNKTVFENKGDVEVGIRIVFKATRGTASNIRFTNLNTGEFVEAITELKQDDELVFSTVQGEKYIRLNGDDIFNTINRQSTFFGIVQGNNLLEYSAETGKTNLEVFLYYVPKYTNGLVIDDVTPKGHSYAPGISSQGSTPINKDEILAELERKLDKLSGGIVRGYTNFTGGIEINGKPIIEEISEEELEELLN